MSTDKRQSFFGVGFSKEVDSILTAYSMGVIYPDEVRDNLRLAGMDLKRQAIMPTFAEPEYEPEFDETEGDTDE